MRKLICDVLFANQLAELELQIPGIRESVTGLKSVLRKNPELGTQVREDPVLWFVPLPDLAPQALACPTSPWDFIRIR